MITIIFSISNLLCIYDQRLSSVSVIPDHDSNPWSWLSSVSVIISCADMIRDHDYLQYQWSLIMIIFGISIIFNRYDIIFSINNHWSWLSSVSIIISCADMIRYHDDIQYQWSLIMIVIPDHDYLQYQYYLQ